MRHVRSIQVDNGMLALVVSLGATLVLGAAEPPAKGPEGKPPWQQLLQGKEAQEVAVQEQRLEQLESTGKLAEALSVAQVLARRRGELQGLDHWEAVDARWTVDALRQALSQGEDTRKDYADSVVLRRQAKALTATGRYKEAQPLLEKSLLIHRKVLGEAHPFTAIGYNEVAVNLNAQGQYAQAVDGLGKALAICRKALGEEHPNTASTYNNLAHNLALQGKYSDAATHLSKALAIWRKVLGEDHAETAICYNNVAGILSCQGKYAEAEAPYAKALAIFRKVLGEEHPNTANSYNNLASNQSYLGKYAEAEAAHAKALAIFRKVLGEDHPDTARCYNNSALNLSNQGKYAEAAAGYTKALVIWRKVLGEDHPDTAAAYSGVAGNLADQGRYAEAEAGYAKALAINRKVLGEGHPQTATDYHNAGGNLAEQGKYAEAAVAQAKALAIRRKVLGEDHPLTASSYNNSADSLHKQGKYAEAAAGYAKALAIYRKVLGEEHPDTVTVFINGAANLAAQGKYAEAEAAHAKALAIFRKVLGEDHPRMALSYYLLAQNLTAQGKYVEAEPLWLNAADCFAKVRLRIAASGLDRATKTGERSPLPSLAGVLARNGKPEAAWQRFEESLARGTWDDLSARLRWPAAEQARQAEFRSRLNHLDQLIERTFTAKEPTPEQLQHRKDLLTQRRQVQDTFDSFARRLEITHGAAAGQVFNRPRLQAALPADTAFVGWLDIPAQPKAADPNGEHWAVLLRATGAPVWVRLGGSGPKDAWTEADTRLPADLRAALHTPRGDWQALAQRLRQQRLEPLAKHLAVGDGRPAVRQLLVLPAPALAGVPVEVFAENYTVSYALSGTLHAHLRKQPPLTTKGLLALADPVFDIAAPKARRLPLPPGGVLLTLVAPGSNAAQAGLKANDVLLRYHDTELAGPADLKPLPPADDPGQRVTVKFWRDGMTGQAQLRPGRLGVVLASAPAPQALAELRQWDQRLATRSGDGKWEQLPGTRAEVEALRRLFGTEPAAQLLVDSQASEQALYDLAQRGVLDHYRYLHFATHGEVDDRFPLRSALILARDHLPDPVQQLNAGLPIYDGRLTAEKVLRQWHLHAELVTLSACQTALGKYERGEGFVGFAQALLLAGSRAVVLSQWKVDDTATVLLMDRFYQNLLGKRVGLKAPMRKAVALAEAKAWLRTLSRDEAVKRTAQLSQGVARGKGRPALPLLPAVPPAPAAARDAPPYAHPYFWAAFVLIGDPD